MEDARRFAISIKYKFNIFIYIKFINIFCFVYTSNDLKLHPFGRPISNRYWYLTLPDLKCLQWIKYSEWKRFFI